MSHQSEVENGHRFKFGENWTKFLDVLDESRISLAQASLCYMLNVSSLEGKRFLDVGSGSGLFSLAARRLGAQVYSFDYDPSSVACTLALKNRYYTNDNNWVIEEGSILDSSYLHNLSEFDVVYSWGVLHHTGSMWQALENASRLVKYKGYLFIAIYNNQGWASKLWLCVKKLYNKLPSSLRWIVIMGSFLRLWGPRLLLDLVTGEPFATWNKYSKSGSRGMSPWRDVVDWVGGLPFEVATPEQVFDFYFDRGFNLTRIRTVGGSIGCNEFVFIRREKRHSMGNY